MLMNNRKVFYQSIDYLLTNYCQGCFLYQYHKKEHGKSYAHQFCIKKCTVGEELKNIGKKLS